MYLNTIQEIRERLDRLELEIRQSFDEQTTTAKPRAVAIKAKNLKPGDVVEWPYGYGQQTVIGIVFWHDRIDLTAHRGNIPDAQFDPEERVRVYRGA